MGEFLREKEEEEEKGKPKVLDLSLPGKWTSVVEKMTSFGNLRERCPR